MACKKCGSEEMTEKPKGPHLGLYCGGCGAWIKWMPQENVSPDMVMPKIGRAHV